VELLLAELPQLPVGEQRTVCSVLLLTNLLDGDVGPRERVPWADIAAVVPRAVCYDARRLATLAHRFRTRQLITAEAIYEAIDLTLHPLAPRDGDWWWSGDRSVGRRWEEIYNAATKTFV
jgi:hypothetical protein